ncbi:MAG: TetR/AcrR family transcriptional regulator [Parvibaculum sp.]|uniref:TetR/AcrR family transcriptional regulator n=1 Tax=Parvibaculum sp. TaxID=2024848 RepID=UPI0025FBDB8B|nr:TetR/AcrR family transcriptional regulator [Parvibaculum sp.]MCE9649433.1 TetR/AcrR family transcriptional regulator [Parvibaculum sp.]
MPKKIDHQARRREIAQAAVSVIGTNGIDNTRLIDVARAAQATTGTITHYFEGKDAVLLAALDHVAQGILHLIHIPVENGGDRDDLIERASLVLPIDDDGKRDWRVWMAFFGRAVGDPALARINNAYYDEFRQGLAKIIRWLQASKKLDAGIDPLLTADSIMTAVDGLGVRASLDPDNWPAERQKQQLRAMLRPLLPTV